MLNSFQHPAAAGREAPRFAGMLSQVQDDGWLDVVSNTIRPNVDPA
jgi:hypothetical protein